MVYFIIQIVRENFGLVCQNYENQTLCLMSLVSAFQTLKILITLHDTESEHKTDSFVNHLQPFELFVVSTRNQCTRKLMMESLA